MYMNSPISIEPQLELDITSPKSCFNVEVDIQDIDCGIRAKCSNLKVVLFRFYDKVVLYAGKMWYNLLKLATAACCDVDSIFA